MEVTFRDGKLDSTIRGRLKGRETVDYRVRAKAGQLLAVNLESSHSSCCFNLMAPGADTAMFIGSTSGDSCSALIQRDGAYTIRVYLMRSAARRGETAKYTLRVALLDTAASSSSVNMPSGPPVRFDATGCVRTSRSREDDRWTNFWVQRDVPRKSATVWLALPSATAGTRVRVLRFAGGIFQSTDGSPVTVEREDDNWLVAVGKDELYIIPDALILGG